MPPPDAGHFLTHLTPKQHEKIVGLVGNRCSISCQLNGKMVEALWDTGSHVSICSEAFLIENFRDTEIRDISDLISANLNLSAANGSAIPYQGWVELEFQVAPKAETLDIPFLIAKESLDVPLIGYNVIEHCINLDPKYATADSLNATFPNADLNKLSTLINFIQTNSIDTDLCSVKINKHDSVIPRESNAIISCRVNHGHLQKRTPVLFEPDELAPWPSGLIIPEALLALKLGNSNHIKVEVRNTSNHDITLKNRTPIGRLQLVQSVTPVEVKLSETPEASPGTDTMPPFSAAREVEACHSSAIGIIPDHLRDISLEGLPPHQKRGCFKAIDRATRCLCQGQQ